MESINENIRIIDLTVGQLMGLLGSVPTIKVDNQPKQEERLFYGIAGIAQLFNCSMTTANRIKASGKIDQAISQCGRVIVVKGDLALELMKK